MLHIASVFKLSAMQFSWLSWFGPGICFPIMPAMWDTDADFLGNTGGGVGPDHQFWFSSAGGKNQRGRFEATEKYPFQAAQGEAEAGVFQPLDFAAEIDFYLLFWNLWSLFTYLCGRISLKGCPVWTEDCSTKGFGQTWEDPFWPMTGFGFLNKK